ncbi:MAG TPA: DUF1697 domain-containing protein [Gemmatimonadales bacterium]
MTHRRYVAFLRAINVGGRVVKMPVLKKIFEAVKLAEVETFIASGNVVFSSSSQAARLEPIIEDRLRETLGYSVVTFLRTTAEVAAVAEYDPFDAPLPPGGRLYVGFLREAPSASARARLSEHTTAKDALAVHGKEVYWRCAVPSMESMVSGAVLERVLGQPATLRNVNTIRRLAAKYPCA